MRFSSQMELHLTEQNLQFLISISLFLLLLILQPLSNFLHPNLLEVNYEILSKKMVASIWIVDKCEEIMDIDLEVELAGLV